MKRKQMQYFCEILLLDHFSTCCHLSIDFSPVWHWRNRTKVDRGKAAFCYNACIVME